MSGKTGRVALYVALIVAYLMHNDLWLWNEARPVLGLPAGLTYHVAFCFVAVGLMILLVRYAWPADIERDDDR